MSVLDLPQHHWSTLLASWQSWKHKDDPICLNCWHWQHQYPEADGRSGGICKRLSGDKWRYDYVPLGDNEKLVLYTRCDFGCNQFLRKPPASGRFEPDIEDTP